MSDAISRWFAQMFGRCLHGQMLGVISRLAPEGREQSRALRRWREVVEERKQNKARLDQAMAKMSPAGRAKSRALQAWAEMARERRRRLSAVQSALARMSPEGRAKYAGMCAFRARSPTWSLPTKSQIDAAGVPPPVVGTKDGFWLTHRSHRMRTSTLGMPFVSRGVYRFGFKVVGSAVGLVVGVADATDRFPSDPMQPLAWGLHLSHGALYTKRANSDKGMLSTKQLVPQVVHNPVTGEAEGGESARVEEGATGGPDALPLTEVEVEVDMDRRRIAFGLRGGALVKAPVKLSGCVRPWCFMWQEGDAVMLDSRPVQGRSSMVTNRRWTSQASTARAPVPLRQRATPARTDLTPSPPSKLPSHAASGDYLPPYAYLPGPPLTDPPYADDAPATPASALSTPGLPGSSPARSAFSSSRLPSPGSAIRAAASTARIAIHLNYSPEGRRQRRLHGSHPEKLARAVTSPVSFASGAAPEDLPQQAKHAAAETITSTKRQQRKAPLTTRASSGAAWPGSGGGSGTMVRSTSPTAPTTPGRNSPRSPRSMPAGQHMWDMVRYVSGVYSDTFRQI